MSDPVYISVDCEFSDGDLAYGALLQVGLVDIDSQEELVVELPLSPDAVVCDWVKENLGPLVERCRLLGRYTEPDLALRVARWLESRTDDGRPVVFVGYVGGFDFGFVHLFLQAAGFRPFHYEMLDLCSLSYGLFPDLPWNFETSLLEQKLDMKPNPHPHDALWDARHQAEMFRRLMFLRGKPPMVFPI